MTSAHMPPWRRQPGGNAVPVGSAWEQMTQNAAPISSPAPADVPTGTDVTSEWDVDEIRRNLAEQNDEKKS